MVTTMSYNFDASYSNYLIKCLTVDRTLVTVLHNAHRYIDDFNGQFPPRYGCIHWAVVRPGMVSMTSDLIHSHYVVKS